MFSHFTIYVCRKEVLQCRQTCNNAWIYYFVHLQVVIVGPTYFRTIARPILVIQNNVPYEMNCMETKFE